ncbi:MAG: oligosaccharide flippase family protein [Victivallales bacterium]
MDKYFRLLKNTGLIFAGTASSRIIGFLLLPFYTKYFSPAEYGTGDLVMVYATMLIAVCSANIYDAVFLFPKGKSLRVQEIYFSSGLFFLFFAMVVTASFFMAIALLGSCKVFFNTFFQYSWWIYSLIVVLVFQNYMQQFARGCNKMVVYVVSGVIFTSVLALLSVILVPQWGISGYLAAQVVAPISAGLYAFYFGKLYRFFSVKRFDFLFLKKMLQFSVPLIPATFLWWLINSSNRPFLENFSGITAVGIFTVSAKMPNVIAMFYSIFGNAWQISAVEEYRKPDYESYFNRMFLLLYIFLIFVASLLAVWSPTIIRYLVSPDFYLSWVYIPILTLAVVFSNMAGFVGVNFTAHKKGSYFLYSSLYCAVVNLLLNYFLISAWGLAGAALSVLGSCLVLLISRIAYSWQYVKLLHIFPILYCTAANLFLILATYLFDNLWLNSVFLFLLFLPLAITYRRNLESVIQKHLFGKSFV